MQTINETSPMTPISGQSPGVAATARPWMTFSPDTKGGDSYAAVVVYEDLNMYKNGAQTYEDSLCVARDSGGFNLTTMMTAGGTKQELVYAVEKPDFAGTEKLLKIPNVLTRALSGIFVPDLGGKMVIGPYINEIAAVAVAMVKATGVDCVPIVRTEVGFLGADYRRVYFLGISVSKAHTKAALQKAKEAGFKPQFFNDFDAGAHSLSFESGNTFKLPWLDMGDFGLSYETQLMVIGFDPDFFGHSSEAEALKFLQAVLGPVGLRNRPYRPPGFDDTTKLSVFCLYEHAETLKETLRVCTEKAKEGHPLLYGSTKIAICETAALGDVYLSVFKKTPREGGNGGGGGGGAYVEQLKEAMEEQLKEMKMKQKELFESLEQTKEGVDCIVQEQSQSQFDRWVLKRGMETLNGQAEKGAAANQMVAHVLTNSKVLEKLEVPIEVLSEVPVAANTLKMSPVKLAEFDRNNPNSAWDHEMRHGGGAPSSLFGGGDVAGQSGADSSGGKQAAAAIIDGLDVSMTSPQVKNGSDDSDDDDGNEYDTLPLAPRPPARAARTRPLHAIAVSLLLLVLAPTVAMCVPFAGDLSVICDLQGMEAAESGGEHVRFVGGVGVRSVAGSVCVNQVFIPSVMHYCMQKFGCGATLHNRTSRVAHAVELPSDEGFGTMGVDESIGRDYRSCHGSDCSCERCEPSARCLSNGAVYDIAHAQFRCCRSVARRCCYARHWCRTFVQPPSDGGGSSYTSSLHAARGPTQQRLVQCRRRAAGQYGQAIRPQVETNSTGGLWGQSVSFVDQVSVRAPAAASAWPRSGSLATVSITVHSGFEQRRDVLRHGDSRGGFRFFDGAEPSDVSWWHEPLGDGSHRRHGGAGANCKAAEEGYLDGGAHSCRSGSHGASAGGEVSLRVLGSEEPRPDGLSNREGRQTYAAGLRGVGGQGVFSASFGQENYGHALVKTAPVSSTDSCSPPHCLRKRFSSPSPYDFGRVCAAHGSTSGRRGVDCFVQTDGWQRYGGKASGGDCRLGRRSHGRSDDAKCSSNVEGGGLAVAEVHALCGALRRSDGCFVCGGTPSTVVGGCNDDGGNGGRGAGDGGARSGAFRSIRWWFCERARHGDLGEIRGRRGGHSGAPRVARLGIQCSVERRFFAGREMRKRAQRQGTHSKFHTIMPKRVHGAMAEFGESGCEGCQGEGADYQGHYGHGDPDQTKETNHRAYGTERWPEEPSLEHVRGGAENLTESAVRLAPLEGGRGMSGGASPPQTTGVGRSEKAAERIDVRGGRGERGCRAIEGSTCSSSPTSAPPLLPSSPSSDSSSPPMPLDVPSTPVLSSLLLPPQSPPAYLPILFSSLSSLGQFTSPLLSLLDLSLPRGHRLALTSSRALRRLLSNTASSILISPLFSLSLLQHTPRSLCAALTMSGARSTWTMSGASNSKPLARSASTTSGASNPKPPARSTLTMIARIGCPHQLFDSLLALRQPVAPLPPAFDSPNLLSLPPLLQANSGAGLLPLAGGAGQPCGGWWACWTIFCQAATDSSGEEEAEENAEDLSWHAGPDLVSVDDQSNAEAAFVFDQTLTRGRADLAESMLDRNEATPQVEERAFGGGRLSGSTSRADELITWVARASRPAPYRRNVGRIIEEAESLFQLGLVSSQAETHETIIYPMELTLIIYNLPIVSFEVSENMVMDVMRRAVEASNGQGVADLLSLVIRIESGGALGMSLGFSLVTFSNVHGYETMLTILDGFSDLYRGEFEIYGSPFFLINAEAAVGMPPLDELVLVMEGLIVDIWESQQLLLADYEVAPLPSGGQAHGQTEGSSSFSDTVPQELPSSEAFDDSPSAQIQLPSQGLSVHSQDTQTLPTLANDAVSTGSQTSTEDWPVPSPFNLGWLLRGCDEADCQVEMHRRWRIQANALGTAYRRAQENKAYAFEAFACCPTVEACHDLERLLARNVLLRCEELLKARVAWREAVLGLLEVSRLAGLLGSSERRARLLAEIAWRGLSCEWHVFESLLGDDVEVETANQKWIMKEVCEMINAIDEDAELGEMQKADEERVLHRARRVIDLQRPIPGGSSSQVPPMPPSQPPLSPPIPRPPALPPPAPPEDQEAAPNGLNQGLPQAITPAEGQDAPLGAEEDTMGTPELLPRTIDFTSSSEGTSLPGTVGSLSGGEASGSQYSSPNVPDAGGLKRDRGIGEEEEDDKDMSDKARGKKVVRTKVSGGNQASESLVGGPSGGQALETDEDEELSREEVELQQYQLKALAEAADESSVDAAAPAFVIPSSTHHIVAVAAAYEAVQSATATGDVAELAASAAAAADIMAMVTADATDVLSAVLDASVVAANVKSIRELLDKARLHHDRAVAGLNRAMDAAVQAEPGYQATACEEAVAQAQAAVEAAHLEVTSIEIGLEEASTNCALADVSVHNLVHDLGFEEVQAAFQMAATGQTAMTGPGSAELSSVGSEMAPSAPEVAGLVTADAEDSQTNDAPAVAADAVGQNWGTQESWMQDQINFEAQHGVQAMPPSGFEGGIVVPPTEASLRWWVANHAKQLDVIVPAACREDTDSTGNYYDVSDWSSQYGSEDAEKQDKEDDGVTKWEDFDDYVFSDDEDPYDLTSRKDRVKDWQRDARRRRHKRLGYDAFDGVEDNAAERSRPWFRKRAVERDMEELDEDLQYCIFVAKEHGCCRRAELLQRMLDRHRSTRSFEVSRVVWRRARPIHVAMVMRENQESRKIRQAQIEASRALQAQRQAAEPTVGGASDGADGSDQAAEGVAEEAEDEAAEDHEEVGEEGPSPPPLPPSPPPPPPPLPPRPPSSPPSPPPFPPSPPPPPPSLPPRPPSSPPSPSPSSPSLSPSQAHSPSQSSISPSSFQPTPPPSASLLPPPLMPSLSLPLPSTSLILSSILPPSLAGCTPRMGCAWVTAALAMPSPSRWLGGGQWRMRSMLHRASSAGKRRGRRSEASAEGVGGSVPGEGLVEGGEDLSEQLASEPEMDEQIGDTQGPSSPIAGTSSPHDASPETATEVAIAPQGQGSPTPHQSLGSLQGQSPPLLTASAHQPLPHDEVAALQVQWQASQQPQPQPQEGSNSASGGEADRVAIVSRRTTRHSSVPAAQQYTLSALDDSLKNSPPADAHDDGYVCWAVVQQPQEGARLGRTCYWWRRGRYWSLIGVCAESAALMGRGLLGERGFYWARSGGLTEGRRMTLGRYGTRVGPTFSNEAAALEWLEANHDYASGNVMVCRRDGRWCILDVRQDSSGLPLHLINDVFGTGDDFVQNVLIDEHGTYVIEGPIETFDFEKCDVENAQAEMLTDYGENYGFDQLNLARGEPAEGPEEDSQEAAAGVGLAEDRNVSSYQAEEEKPPPEPPPKLYSEPSQQNGCGSGFLSYQALIERLPPEPPHRLAGILAALNQPVQPPRWRIRRRLRRSASGGCAGWTAALGAASRLLVRVVIAAWAVVGTATALAYGSAALVAVSAMGGGVDVFTLEVMLRLLTSSQAGSRRRVVALLLVLFVTGVHGMETGGVCEPISSSATVALRVAFWNARHLGASRSCFKRAWLEDQIRCDRPTVVGIVEVDGDFKDMRDLRRWAKRLGYETRFLPGEGRGGGGGSADSTANGMVFMVDRKEATIKSFKRLHERVLGIELHHRDARRRRYALIHGLFDSGFNRQVEEARNFVRQHAQGGLVLGDFNHVPCRRWRALDAEAEARAARGQLRLAPADRAMRKLCGAACSCCTLSGHEPVCRVIGSGGEAHSADGGVGFTRFKTTNKAAARATARYDVAVELGDEEGVWRLVEQAEAENAGRGVLSDHLFITVERHLQLAKEQPRRPSAVARGSSKLAKGVATGLVEGCEELPRQLGEAASEAAAVGQSRIDAVTRCLVQVGKRVEGWVKAGVEQETRRKTTAKANLHNWRARLALARQAKFAGEDPWEAREAQRGLFFYKSGLARVLEHAPIGADRCQGWQAVIRYARRQIRRSSARLHRENKAVERALVEAAKERPDDDVRSRFSRTWKLLIKKSSSNTLENIHLQDKKENEQVHYSEKRFPKELGKIGERFVEGMRRGAVAEAARAWLRIFVGGYAPLKGTDGLEWLVQKELTFDLFVQTLYAMPAGKAVGLSGFSIDLLRVFERGGQVQLAVYDAIMGDLREASIPASWRTVVYALLVKPPPSDASIVSERREIALMEQLMKVVLQGLRSASYKRMEGRILSPQLGWLQGCSTAHVGVQLQVLMQQAARIRHPLYVYYVDLSTFFPSMERGILIDHERLAGVPEDLLNLVAAIYGAAEQEGGSAANGAPCRYDSAAGLSDAFANNMGALMGCVLSPDKAKTFVNSVIAAIHLTVQGPRLWGAAPATQGEVWERLASFAFADDWAGAFVGVEELRLANALFGCWSVATGQKMGVKCVEKGDARVLKTGVTGVNYVDGKLVAAEDPKLTLPDGKPVPFFKHDEVYKHLGIWLRVDAVAGAVFKKVKGKVAFAMGRLSVLRSATREEFCLVADALLGGIVGFYHQSQYLTWCEAEQLEAAFRKAYNRRFGRPASSARWPFYTAAEGSRPKRRHAWSVALASLFAVVQECISEPQPTQQRGAIRSAVAASLVRWGCRVAPHTWDFRHIRQALERELNSARIRFLGDAYMLAAIIGREDRRGGTLGWVWLSPPEAGDPLHQDALHWAAHSSEMVFEPGAAGGLALPPAEHMLQAGLVAVEHFSWEDEGEDVRLARSAAELREMQPQLSTQASVTNQAEKVLAKLHEEEAAGRLTVSQPLAARTLKEGWRDAGQEFAEARRTRSLADRGKLWHALLEDMVRQRDEAAVARRADMEAAGSAGSQAGVPVSEETTARWEERLREASGYEGATASEVVGERLTGVADGSERAAGPRYFFRMPRHIDAFGGEGRWLPREDVSPDGWLVGWENAENEALKGIRLDKGGWWVSRSTGERLTVEEAAERGAAVEMLVRARLSLGDEVTIDKGPPAKPRRGSGGEPEGRKVNLQATQELSQAVVRWWARIGAQAVFTLDGTRQEIVDPQGMTKLVTAWAAVRHDGVERQGALPPGVQDNYMAEMAAQLAVAAEEGLTRVVIVFDASSPVEALRHFLRCCWRKQQRFYRRDWLDGWARALMKFEVVVFIWQTSHVGEPVNELADGAADRAAQAVGAGMLAESRPVLGAPRYASLEVEGDDGEIVSRSAREYVMAPAKQEVEGRLGDAKGSAQVVEGCDMVLSPLSERLGIVADEVLCGRCQVGDPRRFHSNVARAMVARAGCPFGCGCNFTYHDVAFRCQGAPLVQKREEWRRQVTRAAPALEVQKAHWPWNKLMRFLRNGAGAPALKHGESTEIELRRLIGAAVLNAPGALPWATQAVSTAVRLGLELQVLGKEAAVRLEDEVRKEVARCAVARPLARRWALRVVDGGPRRAAALREAALARRAAEEALASMEATTESDLLELELEDEDNELTASELGWEVLRRWELLGIAASAAWKAARECTARSKAIALRDWRSLWLVGKWRWLAMGRARTRQGQGGLAGSFRAPFSQAMLDMREIAIGTCDEDGGAVSGTGVGPTHFRRWICTEEGRTEESRSLAATSHWARRAWLRGGGRRSLEYWRRWDVHAGYESDPRGRWGVERLVDVWRQPHMTGRRLQALVRWRGCDPDTGEAWADTWLAVNETIFTVDMRREARAMERIKYPKTAPPPARAGARRSARLNPSTSAEGEDPVGSGDDMGGADESDKTCEACGGADSGEGNWMLLCDGECGGGFHMSCLSPPLTELPPEEDEWFCSSCRPDVPDVAGEKRGRRSMDGAEALSLPSRQRNVPLGAELWGRPVIVQGSVVPQPQDGNCTYHALSFGLRRAGVAGGVTASQLRQQLASWVSARAEDTVQGTSVRNWVSMSAGASITAYVASMRRTRADQRAWGGDIEMMACVRLHRIRIWVWERLGQTLFERTCCFTGPGSDEDVLTQAQLECTVHVLYVGHAHYDAFQPNQMELMRALGIQMEGDELVDMMADGAARRAADEQMRVRVNAGVEAAMDNGVRIDPRVTAYYSAGARREQWEDEEMEEEMEEEN